MSKHDTIRRDFGANIRESMGAGAERFSTAATSAEPPRWQGVVKSRNAAEIPIDKIGPDPDQPRDDFDPESLGRLAESMKSRGQLQPIRVRWDETRGQYVIICGERRWRAAALAGLKSMTCVVAEGAVEAG